jgi:hypothetical protein
MRQTTLVESLLLNRANTGQAVLLPATYRLKEIVPVAVVLCPRVPKARHPATAGRTA